MEEKSSDKFMALKEAISRFVQNGSHIAIGGSTANRNPMAAVYEIIRQQKKNLHLYGPIMGLGPDLLIGAGCVSAVEFGYVGLGRYAPTGPCFKRYVENGRIRYEDYSNFQMALRFLAGSMGIPFIPSKSSLGSDIVKKLGMDEGFRKSDRRISPKKLIIFTNPFDPNGEEEVVLLPAINPDVTIIHAQKVDRQGNVRIEGLTFSDVEQAKAAKHLIVTCEEIVEHEVLSAEPQLNQLPSFFLDAVVEVPKGAHPTQCYNYYDLDVSFLHELIDASRDDRDLSRFLNRFVISVDDHNEYLGKLGEKVFKEIRADSGIGYKSGLNRKSQKALRRGGHV
jgi:glutaconate CoA-transferase subunit A